MEEEQVNNDELYRPWELRGTALNKALHCGCKYNYWVTIALTYLPQEIFANLINHIAIYSTAERDASLVDSTMSNEREIILLSDRILPKKGAQESDQQVRYFIFTLLHEIAHLYKNHNISLFDNPCDEQFAAFEKEADNLAFLWFNEHVLKTNNQYLQVLTDDEIRKVQEENKALMRNLYDGEIQET